MMSCASLDFTIILRGIMELWRFCMCDFDVLSRWDANGSVALSNFLEYVRLYDLPT